MSFFSRRRSVAVMRSLPDVFMLQPSSNYHALISHSTQELGAKSQKLVSNQMKMAFNYADRKIKNKNER